MSSVGQFLLGVSNAFVVKKQLPFTWAWCPGWLTPSDVCCWDPSWASHRRVPVPERQCPQSQHPKGSTLKVPILELSFGSHMTSILYSLGEKWYINVVQIQGEKLIQGYKYQGYGSLGWYLETSYHANTQFRMVIASGWQVRKWLGEKPGVPQLAWCPREPAFSGKGYPGQPEWGSVGRPVCISVKMIKLSFLLQLCTGSFKVG